MTTKYQVTKFFQENSSNINPKSDPTAHNTNSGLLELVNFMATEFERLHREISNLNRKIDDVEHRLRNR